MGFLKRLLGGSGTEKLIHALSFEGESPGKTWATRREAALKLATSGGREAVPALYAAMNAAVATMWSRRAELSPSELDCLLSWELKVLGHAEAEWYSLAERTSPLTALRIGDFELAWSTALVYADCLARLGEKAAPQELLSELQKLEGAQWKSAEWLLRKAGLL